MTFVAGLDVTDASTTRPDVLWQRDMAVAGIKDAEEVVVFEPADVRKGLVGPRRFTTGNDFETSRRSIRRSYKRKRDESGKDETLQSGLMLNVRRIKSQSFANG